MVSHTGVGAMPNTNMQNNHPPGRDITIITITIILTSADIMNFEIGSLLESSSSLLSLELLLSRDLFPSCQQIVMVAN